MDTKELADVFERARNWPEEDQERLIELAREIEGAQADDGVMTAEERAAIEEGMAQARRGEFLSDAEEAALWRRLGA
jgi:predicted transcriptional regulator